MSYNKEDFPNYVRTAGKITILTALTGFFVFIVTFVYDFGAQELNRVSAQNMVATTTLTVLNTPPTFVLNAFEVIASATSSPTNSEEVLQWQAIGNDSNNAPYFLLICSDNASPTADWLNTGDGTGIGEPRCATPDNPETPGGTAVQWGVSVGTPSDGIATVSTTTLETAASQFDERNEWFAWVCDDDQVNPRCSNIFTQGPTSTPTGTTSSPFHVNNRPVFSPNLLNNGQITGVDPNGVVTWTSTSSDPDSIGGDDAIILIVCEDDSSYNTVTNTCGVQELASTSITAFDNVTAQFTLPPIIMDDTYEAYGYIIDEHGHEASGNFLQSDYIVNNVAPTVLGGDIDLNGGTDITLNEVEGETVGIPLTFTISDANSCRNSAASTSEIVGFGVSIFRANLQSTSSCFFQGDYNANNCYPGRGGSGVTSGVSTSTWDLSCSVVSSCPDDASIATVEYECTFPLWFIADPTDAGVSTPLDFQDDHWSVGVYGLDDDTASGTMATTTQFVDLISFPAIDMQENNIAYTQIEPGQNTDTVNATSTTRNVGNTGLDQEVSGSDMCQTFSASSDCAPSASSTIPADQQRWSVIPFDYDLAGSPLVSTSPPVEIDLGVDKSTVTTTPEVADTYWGIAVPGSITLAGEYTGLNNFDAVVADPLDW